MKDGVDLVNQAGTSLCDMMDSIKGVAGIIADIASAKTEQSEGVDQINKAIMQMDEVTQKNSALVEGNPATAKTLEFQAQAMDEQVAFFQLGPNNTDGDANPTTIQLSPQAGAPAAPGRRPQRVVVARRDAA